MKKLLGLAILGKCKLPANRLEKNRLIFDCNIFYIFQHIITPSKGGPNSPRQRMGVGCGLFWFKIVNRLEP
jgi:hypothetical protein